MFPLYRYPPKVFLYFSIFPNEKIFQNILKYFKYFKIFQNILKYFELPFFRIMEIFKNIGNIWKYFETFGNILKYFSRCNKERFKKKFEKQND